MCAEAGSTRLTPGDSTHNPTRATSLPLHDTTGVIMQQVCSVYHQVILLGGERPLPTQPACSGKALCSVTVCCVIMISAVTARPRGFGSHCVKAGLCR